jgi:hypothetical protein
MSNKILLKRSNQTGKQPTPADLSPGELSLNYADGVLYYLKTDGTVGNISGGGSGGGGSTVTADQVTALAASAATDTAIIMAFALGG